MSLTFLAAVAVSFKAPVAATVFVAAAFWLLGHCVEPVRARKPDLLGTVSVASDAASV